MKTCSSFSKWLLLVIVAIFVAAGDLHAQLEEADATVQVALFAKIIGFIRNINNQTGEVVIEVVDNSTIAAEFKNLISAKIGSFVIKDVREAPVPGSERADIYIVGSAAVLADTLNAAKKFNAVTMTGMLSIIESGVHVGVAVNESGKPAIFINTTASQASALEWDSALLKISRLIK